MLELNCISKDYNAAGGVVHALKGVSLKFRENEFVSILGASGCGKTTLLNIIGGLDKYTSGDLIIEGVSTKKFSSRDWDTYRNHSIGFIFQSYHLIPHQTILQNVELALTISGVGREERRRRAIEALDKVGLKDKIHNRPNQLSGGQAQRVAIARALINNPEIVLADEPTGALDSKTSVQIMELLKEISQDRLVIMVTHNPELAEKYSTRIIRLLDGEVTDDTMPYDGAAVPAAEEKSPSAEVRGGGPVSEDAECNIPPSGNGGGNCTVAKSKGRKKKTSMSVWMAFCLSLKNLLSKFKRTLMVSIAGSIGIIGVSMVLAISAGVQNYITSMQDDLLSGYPLAITETSINVESLMENMSASGIKANPARLKDKVYVDSLIEELMKLGTAVSTNVISEAYVDYLGGMPKEDMNAVVFDYGIKPERNIYINYKVNSKDAGEEVSVTGVRSTYSAVLSDVATRPENAGSGFDRFAQLIPQVKTFAQIPDGYEYILSQYDILASSAGRTNLTDAELRQIFSDKESLVLVLDDSAVTDINIAQFGYVDQELFLTYAEQVRKDVNSGSEESIVDKISFNFDEIIDSDGEESHFKWYPNDAIYSKTSDTDMLYYPTSQGAQVPVKAVYKYNAYSADFDKNRDTSLDLDLKVRLILQRKDNISYGCLSSGMYYTQALADYTLETGRASELAGYMREHDNSLKAMPYYLHYTTFDGEYVDSTTIDADNGVQYTIPLTAYFQNTQSIMNTLIGQFMGGGNASNATDSLFLVSLSSVGGGELPLSVRFYPVSFDAKDRMTAYLDAWNTMCDNGDMYEYEVADGSGTKTVSVTLTENDKINYTDTVGLIITMVNMMIQIITIALIAFTALSLVVSTVMVGIITYVSVVERIKEIGILRAVGARKKDIKRLFNSETFIIGFAAGTVGIGITYLISLILNLALKSAFGIVSIAALPVWQALVMVGISVVLTLISGLIPAAAAAKKDPVVALRTE